MVPLANKLFEPISGGGQVSTGEAFQPVIVRVTDSRRRPIQIMAAPLSFFMTVLRNGESGCGDDGNPVLPVILKVSQSSTTSDMNGFANIVPSASGFSAPVEVDVSVTAGTSAALDLSAASSAACEELRTQCPEPIGSRESQHRMHVEGVWDLR